MNMNPYIQKHKDIRSEMKPQIETLRPLQKHLPKPQGGNFSESLRSVHAPNAGGQNGENFQTVDLRSRFEPFSLPCGKQEMSRIGYYF